MQDELPLRWHWWALAALLFGALGTAYVFTLVPEKAAVEAPPAAIPAVTP